MSLFWRFEEHISVGNFRFSQNFLFESYQVERSKFFNEVISEMLSFSLKYKQSVVYLIYESIYFIFFLS